MRVSLQRRNSDGSEFETLGSQQKNINETKDLWGDDSVDIPVAFDF